MKGKITMKLLKVLKSAIQFNLALTLSVLPIFFYVVNNSLETQFDNYLDKFFNISMRRICIVC